MNKRNILFIGALLVSTVCLAEPEQSVNDLSKARENILAGTIGKSKSPVSGVAQETLNEDNSDQDKDESGNVTTPSHSKKAKKAKSKKPTYGYRDEKILNWIYAANDDTAKENAAQGQVRSVSFKGVGVDNNKTSTSQTAVVSATKETLETKHYSQISGVCTIPEDVSLGGTTKGVLMAFCQTKQGRFKLFGDLSPKAEEYSLTATPLYIEDTYGKRYIVDNTKSYVLNSKKNSYNIATFVNTYAIDKVIRAGIIDNSKLVSTTATQYMQDVKASRVSQESVLVPNAGVVVATNTQKPVASDYVTILGIQMAANLVEKWADYALQEHPWAFMIVGQSKIYADLTVEGVIK